MERFVCVSCFRLFGYSISIQNTTEEAKKNQLKIIYRQTLCHGDYAIV